MVLDELNHALARLLLDASERASFVDGRAPGLDPAVAPVLATIDPLCLTTIATKIRDGIDDGTFGGGGVGRHYPRSCARLAGNGTVTTVIEEFLASSWMARVDCTGLMPGLTATECFYHWAFEPVRPDGLLVLQHEFADAMTRVLSQSPQPGFDVMSPLVRRTAAGWLVIVDDDVPLESADQELRSPLLYAVIHGRRVSGPVSRDVAAALLLNGADPPAWAGAVFVGRSEQARAIDGLLRSKGLV